MKKSAVSFLITLLLITARPSQAQTPPDLLEETRLSAEPYVFYFGGGSGTGTDLTNFGGSKKTFEGMAANIEIPYEMHFNSNVKGGPLETKFTNQIYSDRIGVLSKLVARQSQGEQVFSPDKEIVIVLDTHGKSYVDGNKFGVHFVSTADGLVNVNSLRSTIEMAATHGPKIVVIDNSCESGLTLDLPKNACLISASSAKSNAYSSFTDNFFKRNETNLTENFEDGYLRTREQSKLENPNMIPQISTPEGLILREFESIFDDLQVLNNLDFDAQIQEFKKAKLKNKGSTSLCATHFYDLEKTMKTRVSNLNIIPSAQLDSLFTGMTNRMKQLKMPEVMVQINTLQDQLASGKLSSPERKKTTEKLNQAIATFGKIESQFYSESYKILQSYFKKNYPNYRNSCAEVSF